VRSPTDAVCMCLGVSFNSFKYVDRWNSFDVAGMGDLALTPNCHKHNPHIEGSYAIT